MKHWFGKKKRETEISAEEVLDTEVKKSSEDRERCVFCGKTTEVPKDAPIGERQYYVLGCGQLCQSCYYTLAREEELSFLGLSEKENAYLREKAGK